MPPTPLPTKPHFPIPVGPHRVAVLTVVAFHLCEAHATRTRLSTTATRRWISSLLLSGFVMGDAYNGRWSRLTVGRFCKRRLVPLQPDAAFAVQPPGDFHELLCRLRRWLC